MMMTMKTSHILHGSNSKSWCHNKKSDLTRNSIQYKPVAFVVELVITAKHNEAAKTGAK